MASKIKVLLFVSYLFPVLNCLAQSGITDITHYRINLEDVNTVSKTISGSCEIRFTTSGGNLDSLNLSLLTFSIDSIVHSSGQHLTYLYNDTNLNVALLFQLQPGDTQQLSVYYHGQPKLDPSGWGGVYFSGPYTFNMGVGFDSNPHNFGRAWFPCTDNFTDRASYSFFISTPSGSKAFCNGTLASSLILPNGKIRWNWELTQEIPTYLASFAIAPYYTLHRNYQNIPVEIACYPQDSINVINTFSHLDSVLSFYIQAYGPYRFSKVGYCLIPFNSGAMEHATSIHIGVAFVNGSLTYETLWAHELAHMWWGDWITCESEGDMWLNEGFASFNEAYITQRLYGQGAYRDWIRTNHRKVLQFAHINDNGYLPLINIPHEHTYGQTVYNKGADVAHTLRYYMNDSAFFQGCQAFMNNQGNSAVNSYDLMNELSNSSGTSLNRFFDDWVFTPGFPHFSIDSVEIINSATNSYLIHTRQKSKGNTYTYEMPVSVTCSDGYQDTTFKLLINSNLNSFPVSLNFTPSWFAIDREDQMSDAITDYERSISAPGTNSFPETYLSMNVLNTGNDTSLLRVEHHWVAPDPFKNGNNAAGIRLSNYRYWSVDGILQPGFKAQATFSYNGSVSLNSGYLDNSLITGTEDSILLLYRSDCSGDWQKLSNFTINVSGNKFDKIGSITLDSVMKGEYVMGYYDFTTGISGITPGSGDLKLDIWPNPSSAEVNFTADSKTRSSFTLCIYDSSGRNIYNTEILSKETLKWNPAGHHKGTFVVRIYSEKTELISKSFILIR